MVGIWLIARTGSLTSPRSSRKPVDGDGAFIQPSPLGSHFSRQAHARHFLSGKEIRSRDYNLGLDQHPFGWLMRQLFAPGADAVLRLWLLSAAVVVAALLLVLAGVMRSDYVTTVGVAPAQPVPFSHKHHSGELGIDCRYCHTQVEHYATAGLPPTYTCMTCHSQIWTGAEMLAPVRESLAKDEPLHWTRVNRLPDYVYFNHSIHIAKGVGCSSCHGPVNEMQLTYRAQSFEMQFCLNCHRNPQRYVRPQEQIWNMEWTPPYNQDKLGPELVAQYHIRNGAVLTDCSICHR